MVMTTLAIDCSKERVEADAKFTFHLLGSLRWFFTCSRCKRTGGRPHPANSSYEKDELEDRGSIMCKCVFVSSHVSGDDVKLSANMWIIGDGQGNMWGTNFCDSESPGKICHCISRFSSEYSGVSGQFSPEELKFMDSSATSTSNIDEIYSMHGSEQTVDKFSSLMASCLLLNF